MRSFRAFTSLSAMGSPVIYIGGAVPAETLIESTTSSLLYFVVVSSLFLTSSLEVSFDYVDLVFLIGVKTVSSPLPT